MARYFERVPVAKAESMVRSDLAAMRKMYTEMRDVAQKRIQRMSRTEYVEAKTFKEHSKGFAKLSEISPENFAKAYSDLSKFVGSSRSTIKGQRAMQQKTTVTINDSTGASKMDEEGKPMATPLTKANYWRFIKILEKARKSKITYDSNTMSELAEATLALSDKQFDDALDHLAALLEHSDEVAEKLEQQRDAQSGMLIVNMDDFVKEAGWESSEM